MKYVIWDMDADKFWSKEDGGHWTNRYYATKYTAEEIESVKSTYWIGRSEGRIVALVALSI